MTSTRIKLEEAPRTEAALKKSYDDAVKYISAASSGIPALEACAAMIRLFQAQTCGKCVPCRIGAEQIVRKIDEICDGLGTPEDVEAICKAARNLQASADCALGMRIGDVAMHALNSFGDELEQYLSEGCILTTSAGVPCSNDCPAHIDIPGYIALVNAGRYEDAVRLIRRDNPLPTVCAFICEHPCEQHCRRQVVDAPVSIREIKRVAVDKAGDVPVPEPLPSTGKRIAVIGGGPSGITAAYYLQLMGHSVEIFERQPELGGMIRYGIPAYRLPRTRLDEEINALLSTGIKVHLNSDISGTDLIGMGLKFDAIYLAIGAHTDKKLNLEGENTFGVMSAVDLLRSIGLGYKPEFEGKKIVVVGGGNVAMDCVRSAVRLGASEVICAYRRRKDDMTALAEEIEGAIAETVEVMELAAPASLRIKDGKATGLYVQPQLIGAVKGGRPAPIPSPEAPQLIEADYIIVAIGQDIESKTFEEFGIKANRNRFIADPSTASTLEGVFVGGDCQSGPATVIKAVAAGKTAAANIDEYLGFDHKLVCDIDIPAPNHKDIVPAGRVLTPERPASERKNDFEVFELCINDQAAAMECSRCLRCDHHGFNTLNNDWGAAW